MKRSYKQATTPEHEAWYGMRRRVLNPDHKQYRDYGGRGIKICDRWLGVHSHSGFKYFLEDMGLRPSPLHSIDRIDNDGDYEPTNCRWVTRDVQNNNRRKKYNKYKTNGVNDESWRQSRVSG